jgi:ABC-2 type transport system ATP-binding protein
MVGTPMEPDHTDPLNEPDPPPAIRIEQLTKRLRNGIVAVDGLDLDVAQGQVVGLVGPNGSGKTITLRILLGLVRPTSGRVLLFGQEVRPGARVLGRVGALVDGPGFVPHLSGRRNLDLSVRQIRLSGGSADLDAAVGMAGLGQAIDRAYSGYSHGMRYRLAMAQALLGSPDLLLLDEPTTGMDPSQAFDVHDAIAACAATGTTVVLSSHLMSEVQRICTHAAIVRSGRLVAAGSVTELVGTTPRLIMEVDNRDRAIAVLRGLPGVSRITATGIGSVAVEGRPLGPVQLLEALDRQGVRVSGFRTGNFEDSYLDLFAADPNEAPLSGSAER